MHWSCIRSADLCDAELEIRPIGTPWAGKHTAVRERHHGDEVRFAAVFPALVAGTYEIRVRHGDGEGTQAVAVAPAGVTEVVFGLQ